MSLAPSRVHFPHRFHHCHLYITAVPACSERRPFVAQDRRHRLFVPPLIPASRALPEAPLFFGISRIPAATGSPLSLRDVAFAPFLGLSPTAPLSRPRLYRTEVPVLRRPFGGRIVSRPTVCTGGAWPRGFSPRLATQLGRRSHAFARLFSRAGRAHLNLWHRIVGRARQSPARPFLLHRCLRLPRACRHILVRCWARKGSLLDRPNGRCTRLTRGHPCCGWPRRSA